MHPHALRVLEFREALEGISRFAASPLGAEAVRALTPGTDRAAITAELSRVDEARRLATSEGWEMPPVPDASDALRTLGVAGSVLDGTALREVGTLLASCRLARARFSAGGDDLARLAALVERLPENPAEEAAISRTVDDAGEVRDDASPELARLRRELRTGRGRIVGRLNEFVTTLPANLRVADASVTVREGRYVIPVRREGRSEVGGIVHGESGSGATLFIEPPVAVELMNRLREAEAAEAREVLRILRVRTDALRPDVDELGAGFGALVELDSLLARGRFAAAAGAEPPELLAAGEREYTVMDGRHPILFLREERPVPFSLRMEEGERTLLVSGPNTGGKTVLLKAVGLLALLAQSGVIPPVGPGTRLPIFREVFADIGDEQSIEASLSTFSAHLRNLDEILARADADSLVLIDEIGSGTDPTEGAALARALLLELHRRSAFTLATTHLGALKLLASERPGVVNASLQFDAEKLEPTYRLVKGVPGRSYGLAIARRLGLPATLLDEAEASLPEGERDVGRLLLDLERSEREAERHARDLEGRLAETEKKAGELERREAELKARERAAEQRARQQARDLLLDARKEVEAAIEEVRAGADDTPPEEREDAARSARRRVEQAAALQRERTPSRAAPRRGKRAAPAALEPGVRVRIPSLGRTGSVAELRDDRAVVEAGGVRLVLARTELEALPPGDQPAERQEPRRAARSATADFDARPEVDLRGLRVDELEFRLGPALDAAVVSGLSTFRVIHGKGTGALRARVEEMLETDRRVASFRPGERYEGGTGVTVVDFA